MAHSFWHRLTILLMAAVIADSALGMWAMFSEQELIERSDLIVVGTLASEQRHKSGERELRVGVIKIDEALKGSAPSEVLLALPANGQPISSSDLNYRIGQSGLWYLRAPPQGGDTAYKADHPQRFVPRELAQPAIEKLRAKQKR